MKDKMTKLLRLQIEEHRSKFKLSKKDPVKIIDNTSDEIDIIHTSLHDRAEMLKSLPEEKNIPHDRIRELEILIDFHDAVRDVLLEVIEHNTNLLGKLKLNNMSNKTLYVKVVEKNHHDVLSRVQQYRAGLYRELVIEEDFKRSELKAGQALYASNIGIFIGMLGISLGLLAVSLSIT